MSALPIADWLRLTLSVFNLIILLWLGLTVLLNAEHRSWAIWTASGGLLLAGGFFVSHTTLLADGFVFLSRGTTVWLAVGMVPAVVLPFGWYVVMLWYAGYWEVGSAELRRRHRPRLVALLAMLVGGLVGLAVLALPYVASWRAVTPLIAPLRALMKTPVASVPVVVLAYPGYVLLNVVLALDALRAPGPSRRAMGELARRRARPWLVAASALLVGVSVLLAWVIVWTISTVKAGDRYVFTPSGMAVILRFDLAIAFLVALAALALGQAIVSYELFTGRTLPRRGLARFWQRVVAVALVFSALISAGWLAQLRVTYLILLSVVLTAVVLALLSWQAYVDREQFISGLRPFVSSQRLFDLLTDQRDPERSVPAALRALCVDVLDTRRALVVPVGPLAALVGPLAYPDDGAALPNTARWLGRFTDPTVTYLPAGDSAESDSAEWAWVVSLWSARGLIGLLFLAEKRSGGLYSQEEIEIARASGERLIDTQAGVALSSRLMGLQRRHLAERQLLDQRARRALHDDVLPVLHAALLTLPSDGTGDSGDAAALLGDAHRRVSDLLRELPAPVNPDVSRLGVIGALRRVVAVEHDGAFDEVVWEVSAEAAAACTELNPVVAETVYFAARELVRNAARHARRPDRPLTLTVQVACTPTHLALTVADDGVGVAPGAAEGGGHGLALHSTLLAVVGGTLASDSVPGRYTRGRIELPRSAMADAA